MSLCWYWKCIDLFVRRLPLQASSYEPAVILRGVGSTTVRPSIVDTSQISTAVAHRAEATYTYMNAIKISKNVLNGDGRGKKERRE